MAHSRFSPSATAREVLCPPSFLLSEKFPDVQSADAAHGTAAHRVGELCLTKGVDTDHYAGCRIAVDKKGRTRFVTSTKPLRDDELEFEVDDEMVDNVQKYVSWCRELPGEHFVEVRVEHTKWCPDVDENGGPLEPQYGTSDHNACIPAGVGRFVDATLVITDLKYGRGVQVFAFGNGQAIKYALGAVDEWGWIYGFKRVIIRICQPRINHFDVWELTVEELYEWGDKIKAQLTEVFNPNAKFNPGEKQCKFCKVKNCKPRHDYIFQQNVMLLDELEEFQTDPNLLDSDELYQAHRLIPLMEVHINHIRSAVYGHLLRGEEVGDLFLVESNTNRQWAMPEAEIEAELRKRGIPVQDMWKKVFFSPAQAEGLLPRHSRQGGKRVTGKERASIINEFTRKLPGAPVVAQPGDKRKRYVKPELDLDGLD